MSQNFICYYQVEVSSTSHDPAKPKETQFEPTKVEFEMFLDVPQSVLLALTNF